MTLAYSSLAYLQLTPGGDYVFRRKQHRAFLLNGARDFFRQYAEALAASGLTAFRVREVMQASPGCLSHAIQQWRLSRVRLSDWHHLSDKTAADLCRIGGWLHTAHLTPLVIDTLVGHNSDFTQSIRRTVLRDVLRHSKSHITPPPHKPIRRQRKPKPHAQHRWTAEHLAQFRRMFPDSSAEGVALNIMLHAMPTWHRLQQLGWKDLSRIAIPGSDFDAHLRRKFQHIPDTALSFMQHSLRTVSQAHTANQLGVTRSRMQAACSAAGVPQLTRSSLLHLNAHEVAHFIVPQKVNSPILACNCSSV